MEPKTITTDQIRAMQTAWTDAPPPYPIVFELMLQAGLRVGEVTKLAWIDLMHLGAVKQCLTVDRNTAKGARERIVPITRELHKAVLRAWTHGVRDTQPHAADYVAASHPHGNPITPRSIERHIAKLARTALGIDLNPHMLRHTFATRLLAVSNLEIVRKALGHKRVSTTQCYVHTSLDQLKHALDKLD